MATLKYFADFPELGIPDAHIDVIYKDGKFLDGTTKMELSLEYNSQLYPEGIHLKLLVPLFALNPEEQKAHIKVKRKLFLKIGSLLYFAIDDLSFYCELENDLYLIQVGNRTAKLSPCSCKLKGADDSRGRPVSPFHQKTYDSLNQLYTGTSMDYFGHRKYHIGNAFKKFSTRDRKTLQYLRDTFSWED
ncbi:hypothetical protein [Algoriphagus mannitolivorans]|uniref:hypothetical protein n=1 Tax=Algoriphagus mannitolivorans TaxID=226504 RepID=UPI0004267FC8|nr:hypothetical protein [Algoriphagus mannitolivorans]